MRILLLHNEYGKYSGEEAVVDKTAALFRGLGHEVRLFTRSSAEIPSMRLGKARALLTGLWNPVAIAQLKKVLREFRPEVVQVHNLYPLISPMALFACKEAGAKVIMTVHNFRLICPTGLFLRDNRPCEQCLHGSVWNGLRHNCEQDWLKSFGYVLRNQVADWTGAYHKCVDHFACITDFQRQKLMEAGYDPARISVIPNAYAAPEGFTSTEGEYVAYVGRLSPEKGWTDLLEAARALPHIPFRLAGALRDTALAALPPNVQLVGHLSHTELQAFIHNARFLLMPSRCYEGFPISLLEAASLGKAAIGPAHAGFLEIISEGETGLLFRPSDIADMQRQVERFWQDTALCQQMGANAFERLQQQYAEQVVQEQWRELLQKIMGLEMIEKVV